MFYVLNLYVKQRTVLNTMYMQDGLSMTEFSLAATKQREVQPYDDITFVYWFGNDTPCRLFVGIA